jgi:aldose 1-epimerase
MNSVKKIRTKQGNLNLIEVSLPNIKASFLDYGATIYDIKTKDKNGEFESIALKYQDINDYFNNNIFLNSTVGPLSGRTKDGLFYIDDKKFQLDLNDGKVDLHSGKDSLASKYFDFEIIEDEKSIKVIFTHIANYDSAFPGVQVFKTIYTISETSLLIEFLGETDTTTAMNLTNHVYFNLSGDMKSRVLDSTLKVNSSRALKTDEDFVPCAVFDSTNSHLDFRKTKRIKDSFFEGIYDTPAFGIDDQFLVDEVNFDISQATLTDEVSNRTLDVYTTYPVIVIYTHNHISNQMLFDGLHTQHMGICFETQYESNGINIPEFNNSILRKDEKYYHKTLYKFGLKKSM